MNQERNQTIYQEYINRYRIAVESGHKPATMRDLALKYHVSPNRIWQIVHKEDKNYGNL